MGTQGKERPLGYGEKHPRAKTRTLSHWQEPLLGFPERPDETIGTVFSRKSNFSDMETFFLHDSVGWGVFSHDILDYRMPFSKDELNGGLHDKWKLAVLEGPVNFDDDDAEPDPNNPMVWSKGCGALCAKPGQFETALDVFRKQIRYAIKQGAHVIMTGEFSCPACETQEQVTRLETTIRKEIAKAKQPVFFVAGSHHRPRQSKTGRPYNANVAMVFGGDTDHEQFEKELEKQPFDYFKRSPAINIGERVFSPKDEKMPIFITPFGNIGLMICSDAFDTRILYAFLRENRRRHYRTQFILIPTYNDSPEFYRSCRYLSYLANAAVIVFNSNTKETFPHESTKFFVAGMTPVEIGNFLFKGKAPKPEEVKPAAKTDSSIASVPPGVGIKAESSPRNWDEAMKLKAKHAFEPDGFKKIERNGAVRKVALFEIDRVSLEGLCKGLLKEAGPIVKKARTPSKANG